MPQNNFILKSISPVPSLKDIALSTIKEAILTEKLEQGVMYAEATFATELGISRTPVREALIHLASRGLIIYYPRKGFQIKLLTEKDVRDLFELRLALELAVIRHITSKLTAESLAEIEGAWASYLKAVEMEEPDALMRANRDFHLCLANLTENDYLINALEQIRDLIDLASFRSLEISSRSIEAVGEHERIIAELKLKSLSGALLQMEAHIRTTEERVLSAIQNSIPIDKQGVG
ncbi:MAG: GntR family transcriptional regulator [Smithellaceae bacterium]|nr:GntR family transcriptional regulator [Smithellaceae bacterium]